MGKKTSNFQTLSIKRGGGGYFGDDLCNWQLVFWNKLRRPAGDQARHLQGPSNERQVFPTGSSRLGLFLVVVGPISRPSLYYSPYVLCSLRQDLVLHSGGRVQQTEEHCRTDSLNSCWPGWRCWRLLVGLRVVEGCREEKKTGARLFSVRRDSVLQPFSLRLQAAPVLLVFQSLRPRGLLFPASKICQQGEKNSQGKRNEG